MPCLTGKCYICEKLNAMRRIIKCIPNTLTLANLFCGCLAVTYALDGDARTAFWLVITAAVFDFFDGFAARLLKAHSPIGADLDSLADMVSFGVVPSAVLYSLGLGWFGFIVALFSALRLAKFNIDERQSVEFIGLPTPANALFFTSIGYVLATYDSGYFVDVFSTKWFLYVLAVSFSLLMVSEIRMFSLKLKSFSFKANALVYCFLIFSAVLLVIFGVGAVPFVMLVYIITSLVRNVLQVRKVA